MDLAAGYILIPPAYTQCTYYLYYVIQGGGKKCCYVWIRAPMIYDYVTPPRPSEIKMKNWRAKVKPVLTPHL